MTMGTFVSFLSFWMCLYLEVLGAYFWLFVQGSLSAGFRTLWGVGGETQVGHMQGVVSLDHDNGYEQSWFLFWVTLSGAQGVLLALHSSMTIWDSRD